MRRIERIFVHCTATPQAWGVTELRKSFKQQGWKYAGYHYVITVDGGVHQMEAIETIANGVKGYNATAIHIAYVGGIDKQGKAIDNRTDAQKESLHKLIWQLKKRYPNAIILGHRDVSPDINKNGRVDRWERIKECPCFEVREEFGMYMV